MILPSPNALNPKPPRERSVREFRFMATCLGLLSVIAIGAVFYLGKSVFLPLIFAFLLSYVFSPVVRWLTQRHVPLFISVTIIIGVLFVVISLSILALSGSMNEFVQVIPTYYEQFMEIAKTFSQRFDIPDHIWKNFDWGSQLRTYLFSLSGSLVSITSKFVLTLIFMVFLLMGSPFSDLKLKHAFPHDATYIRARGIIKSVSSQITKFITLMTLISALTGVCVWIALWIIGVDFAATWGLLAFFLNFIPTIGSIVASIPPIVVAVVKFYPNWVMPVATAGALLAIQMTIGNIMAPKIMGDSLHLSPVTIMVSLLVWGLLWGVPGALLAVPMAAILKIICDNFPALHPFAVLFSSGQLLAKEINKKDVS